MGPVERTVTALAQQVGAACQVVVVCGRNKRLVQRLQARQYPEGMKVVVTGGLGLLVGRPACSHGHCHPARWGLPVHAAEGVPEEGGVAGHAGWGGSLCCWLVQQRASSQAGGVSADGGVQVNGVQACWPRWVRLQASAQLAPVGS